MTSESSTTALHETTSDRVRTADGQIGDDEPPSHPVDRRGWRWQDHPLAVVAVISTLGAIGSAVWIWRSRHLGSYDPDEAGYLATALRFHREAGLGDPVGLVREMGRTSHGPLVPLLSQPFLAVGPRDPRTAMLVQPVLLVLLAVSVAGITRRLAGPLVTVLAGCFAAALPTVVAASESYWYGLGAAVCMSAAVWALLSSERLTNRNAWWFGIATGLMPLARTMALGFVPALVAAAVVVAWHDRRSWRGLAKALLVATAVAAPWWIARRDEIFDYLLSYGFGERAGLWGSGGPLDRVVFRLDRLVEGALMVGPWGVVAALGLLAVLGDPRTRRGWRGEAWSDRRRSAVAVAVAVASGFAALVSTTNRGVWFELPLLAVAIALVAAVVARAPALLRVPFAAWVALAALTVPVIERVDGSGHLDAALAQYDRRFTGDADARRAAETDWSRLNERVAGVLRELTGDGTAAIPYVTGNTFLFNSNSIELAAEMSGWSPGARVPDTVGGPGRRAVHLTPLLEDRTAEGAPIERLLVVARHDMRLFTPDRDVRALDSEALGAGWREVSTFPMPVPGEVVVLRHRAASAD